MKVLITGATGLIGRELVRRCITEGIGVHYLTTRKSKLEVEDNYKGFYWNPTTGEIDKTAFKGVTAIINLAGANIGRRWTEAHKTEILKSRTQPAALIFETLQEIDHAVVHFISASGIGIYPASETNLYTEESTEVDNSFLAEVVLAWEAGADRFRDLGMEVSLVRTGMVLDKNDGAFPKIAKTVSLWLGSPLGSGNQWQSWIHIADVAGIYLYILKKEMEGVYNAVAPNPVTNQKLTRQIANHLSVPLWMPKVPAFVLKLILGDMATLALEGQLVSAQKIELSGYIYEYPNIEVACTDLL